MTVPNPRTVDRKLRELDSLTRDLVAAGIAIKAPYKWAYEIGLSPTVADTAGGSQLAYSDPTLAVVENPSKERVRAACVHAVRALDDAMGAVREATRMLEGAATGLGKLLPPPGAWAIVRAEQRGKELDHRLGRGKTEEGSFLAPGEYEASVAAQRARGEGYGET